ncbi:hypothetical protein K1X76_07655 [bacterium]|nr:hypothetical protein [bacterium]
MTTVNNIQNSDPNKVGFNIPFSNGPDGVTLLNVKPGDKVSLFAHDNGVTVNHNDKQYFFSSWQFRNSLSLQGVGLNKNNVEVKNNTTQDVVINFKAPNGKRVDADKLTGVKEEKGLLEKIANSPVLPTVGNRKGGLQWKGTW